MVPAQQVERLRVLDLVRQQQADHLKPSLAAIDVISEEEIILIGRVAAVIKEAEQVVILPVHVAADRDWRLELEKRRLISNDGRRLIDEKIDLLGCEVAGGAGLLVAEREQP